MISETLFHNRFRALKGVSIAKCILEDNHYERRIVERSEKTTLATTVQYLESCIQHTFQMK